MASSPPQAPLDRIAASLESIEAALNVIETKAASYGNLRETVVQAIAEVDAILAVKDEPHG